LFLSPPPPFYMFSSLFLYECLCFCEIIIFHFCKIIIFHSWFLEIEKFSKLFFSKVFYEKTLEKILRNIKLLCSIALFRFYCLFSFFLFLKKSYTATQNPTKKMVVPCLCDMTLLISVSCELSLRQNEAFFSQKHFFHIHFQNFLFFRFCLKIHIFFISDFFSFFTQMSINLLPDVSQSVRLRQSRK